MKALRALLRCTDGVAAAEMALVAPMLIILMFGTMELGNYFLTQHAITKHVRDGARYASRLTLAADYSCTAGSDLSGLYEDADAATKIANVTRTGSVDGLAAGRFGDDFWSSPCDGDDAVAVSIRCVDNSDYGGIYASSSEDIPVVAVSANVAYPSLFGALGFDATGLCAGARSEAAVAGL